MIYSGFASIQIFVTEQDRGKGKSKVQEVLADLTEYFPSDSLIFHHAYRAWAC